MEQMPRHPVCPTSQLRIGRWCVVGLPSWSPLKNKALSSVFPSAGCDHFLPRLFYLNRFGIAVFVRKKVLFLYEMLPVELQDKKISNCFQKYLSAGVRKNNKRIS